MPLVAVKLIAKQEVVTAETVELTEQFRLILNWPSGVMEIQRFPAHQIALGIREVGEFGQEIAIAGALRQEGVPELPRRGKVAVEQNVRLRILHQDLVLWQAETRSGL